MTKKKKKKRSGTNATNQHAASSPQSTNLARQMQEIGFSLVRIEADGNCMFRALSFGAYGSEWQFDEVRQKIVTFIEENRDDFEPFMEDEEDFDRYCSRLRGDGVWGGNQELCAAARALNFNITVFNVQEAMSRIDIACNDAERPTIHLVYSGSEHYDSLEPLNNSPAEMPIKSNRNRIKRNHPCPCGSKLKYRDCCKKSDKHRQKEALSVEQLADELNTIQL